MLQYGQQSSVVPRSHFPKRSPFTQLVPPKILFITLLCLSLAAPALASDTQVERSLNDHTNLSLHPTNGPLTKSSSSSPSHSLPSILLPLLSITRHIPSSSSFNLLEGETTTDNSSGGGGGSGFPMWILGCILSFAGCTLSNVGVNMQKMAHNRLEADKSVTGDRLWVLGLLSIGIGSVADLVSYSFASMSLLAPLGAMTLVVNLFLAPCFNKENLSRRDIVVTMIILAGTIISVVFGSKEESKYTLSELVDLYSETLFIVYAVLIGIYIFLFMIWLYILRRREEVYGIELTPSQRAFQAFGYPSMAGVFGAHSVLCAKSASEVIKVTIDGDNQFDKPLSYFFVVLLVIMVFFQMKLLNQGLSKADALYIVPVYQVCWVVMNAVVGMTYFREYREMTAVSASMFTLGIIITTIGVYLLSKRNMAVDVAHTQLDDDTEGLEIECSENKKEGIDGDKPRASPMEGDISMASVAGDGAREPEIAMPHPKLNGSSATGVTANGATTITGVNGHTTVIGGLDTSSPALRPATLRRPGSRQGSPALRPRGITLPHGPSARAVGAGNGPSPSGTPAGMSSAAPGMEDLQVSGSPVLGSETVTPTASQITGRRRTASFVVGFHVYTVPVPENTTTQDDFYVEPLNPALATEAAHRAIGAGGVTGTGHSPHDRTHYHPSSSAPPIVRSLRVHSTGTSPKLEGQEEGKGSSSSGNSVISTAGTVLSTVIRPLSSLIERVTGTSSTSSEGLTTRLSQHEDAGDSPSVSAGGDISLPTLPTKNGKGDGDDSKSAANGTDTPQGAEIDTSSVLLREKREVTSSRHTGNDRAVVSARPTPSAPSTTSSSSSSPSVSSSSSPSSSPSSINPKLAIPVSSSGSNLKARSSGDDLIPSTPKADDDDDDTMDLT